MKWWRWVAACAVIAVAMAWGASPAQAWSVEEDAIRTYFPAHEVDDALYIAECESGLGLDIYNEWSGAYGLFQFMPATSYGMGFDHAAMADPYYAAAAAAELQDLYGWGQWACAY